MPNKMLVLLLLIPVLVYWKPIITFVHNLYSLLRLKFKGPRYFTEDLAPRTLEQSDGIICKPLLPCGLLSVGVVNGPDGKSILHLLNSYDNPEFRMTLNIFKHIVPGFIENKTDASFFIRSDREAFIHRQRSLIPYIRDPQMLTLMFDQLIIEFRNLLKDWTNRNSYESIDYNLTHVIFRVVSRIFFGLDNMDFDKVYRTNKIIEYALNYGSIPDIFRFFSFSQRLVMKARQSYNETYKELLEMNIESILATDNYTHYIVKQCAALRDPNNIRNYVSHDDILASSPLLYLGIANITTCLGHFLLRCHQPEYLSFIEQLQREIQQLPSETLDIAQKSRLLETYYLEIVRLTRPASIVTRMTSNPILCGKQVLPANTLFGIVNDSLLVDPRHWGTNSTDFDPTRFDKFPSITGVNAKQYPNTTHGLGQRSCPGDLIAYNAALAFFISFFDGQYKVILDPINPPLSEIKSAGALCRLSDVFRAKIIIQPEWEEINTY